MHDAFLFYSFGRRPTKPAPRTYVADFLRKHLRPQP